MDPVTAVTTTPQVVARRPFRFSTSFVLEESTGLRAATLPMLADVLRRVPPACIYYHTHHFLLQHHYLTPEPTNDFAYWVGEVLGEEALGEQLANVDIVTFDSLEVLRGTLVGLMESYLRDHPTARLRFTAPGEEFFFVKAVHVSLPTPHTATTIDEFARALEQVTVRSLYFHIFEARLRVGRATNDFSAWLSSELGLTALAENIAALDPYAHTLETLRAIILSLIQQAIRGEGR